MRSLFGWIDSPQREVPQALMTTTIQAPANRTAPSGRLLGLQCRECGQLYPLEALHVCELCFGPLEVAYDYDILAATVTRESIAAGPPTLWRYRALLPVQSE